MVDNNFMAVMTVVRIIAIRPVQVMALVADALKTFIIFMFVVISMRPSGT